MLLIKTKIAPSLVHGIGVFAAEFIKKNTAMWKFQPGFDLQLSPKTIEALSEAAKEQVRNYAYLSKANGLYILCSDDARFYNHSNDPNTGMDPRLPDENLDIALRDIHPGEEILCDYGAFDSEHRGRF